MPFIMFISYYYDNVKIGNKQIENKQEFIGGKICIKV